MEKFKNVISWLLIQPAWIKVVAVLIAAAAAALFLFSSCSSMRSIPNISDNKIGAEGVISKEKNVNKQTKWYFKPDSVESQIE